MQQEVLAAPKLRQDKLLLGDPSLCAVAFSSHCLLNRPQNILTNGGLQTKIHSTRVEFPPSELEDSTVRLFRNLPLQISREGRFKAEAQRAVMYVID